MLQATSFDERESLLFKFVVFLLIINAFGIHYAISVVFFFLFFFFFVMSYCVFKIIPLHIKILY